MTVSLFAFTCGQLQGDLGRLMEGGEGRVDLPIPSFLIEHPKGRALFDSGLHPACQHDPEGRLGTHLATVFSFNFKPGEEVSARLTSIDRDPGRIDFIINSHLHFDHVGGNALIPNATMIVQRQEWEARLNPEIAVPHGYNPADYDHGHGVRLADGEYDVFGDGSVVCIPTHGHTPGHQSLRVKLAHGEAVLTADACYSCQTLRERRLPRRVFNREAMLESLDRLQALEAAGARLVFGHDAERWRSVPQGRALDVGANGLIAA